MPEFADGNAYTDSMISYWLAYAKLMLPTSRWGVGSVDASAPPTTILDFGTEALVAHMLTLERQQIITASVGGAPGVSQGPVSSKSVGPVSVSYDVNASIEENGGFWNLTVYGTRFLRLAKQIGMGPIQVSGPFCPAPYSGSPWGGPFVWGGSGPNGGSS